MSRIHGDLEQHAYVFSLAVLAIVDDLPSKQKGWIVGRQLLRSATSIGANICEADQAPTDADFVYKCTIARKEARESNYWLRLCRDGGLLPTERSEPLIRQSDELMRILPPSSFAPTPG